MDEIIGTGVDPNHAIHYIGCAVSVALAIGGMGLSMAIFNCLTLIVIDP
jgi:hypothetical protein